ncbi:hypothetical protein HanIR_Chr11g0560451 [Helianthus annuus]|nr:hypothetical protein HanIR_Chr11g0560451 [Helianthus annuus]
MTTHGLMGDRKSVSTRKHEGHLLSKMFLQIRLNLCGRICVFHGASKLLAIPLSWHHNTSMPCNVVMSFLVSQWSLQRT